MFNARGISCIPASTYLVIRVLSPKHGNTFQVQAVPNRDGINFHKGNLWDDTEGCILVGEQFEPVKGQPGIVASTAGFAQFLELLKGHDEFELTIKEAV